jgi:GNAT superfamily N-acetyltransferase
MEFEVRAAEPGEEESIVPLYEWLFAPPGARPAAWDERRAAVALRQAIDSHDACVLVAVQLPAASSQGARATDDPGEARICPGAAGPPAIVGFLTTYQDLHSVRFGYRAWVEDFAVDPGRRSRGVGKRLLDAAKDWARERGATHLELDSAEARRDAHRFYEREGAAYRAISFGWEL